MISNTEVKHSVLPEEHFKFSSEQEGQKKKKRRTSNFFVF